MKYFNCYICKVKKAYQILSVMLGMILIVSSTGILIYKTHCACTGKKEVSIYVMPETCEEDFHVHHLHDKIGCEIETNEVTCHECSSHDNGCGCTSPEVEFIKLINQISEDDVSFVKVHPVKITAVIATLLIGFNEIIEKEPIEFYTDPPPQKSNPKSFLIEVHQLKIPVSA